MSLGLPLIAWGSVDAFDAAPWSVASGAITVTGGQTGPFGGANAYLLNGTSAVAPDRLANTLGAMSGAGFSAALFVKQGTATTTTIGLVDTTAVVSRLVVDITWTAGVPSVALNTGGGVYGALAVGGSWYLLYLRPSGTVSGNAMRWDIYPNGATAANTGSTYVENRNIVLLDYLDTPIADETPREGSEWVQSYSGVEDAWFNGPDYRLSAKARWIPTTPQSSPVIVSGWDGRNEATGVNCGVAAMLRAGRQKATLRFVPDRSACTTYIDSYLVDPLKDPPTLEANNGPYRTFPLVLRNASTPYEGVP